VWGLPADAAANPAAASGFPWIRSHGLCGILRLEVFTHDERCLSVTIHPKVPKDLALAPVAAGIDLNLRHLRDKSPAEIDFALALALNRTTSNGDRADRAEWVLDEAVRGVEMHAWHTEITSDSARLRLSGGSVTIDLGLSASILRYIENGA
jgi:hypothetical protein